MAETILITKDIVRQYRKIDPKIDQDKFDGYAMDVQRRNLRELLGQSLYYDFFNNITEQKYIDLRDGKTYEYGGKTVQYYGLLPLLSYWWLSVAAREGDLFHSNVGAIQFTNNPQQSFETAKNKERIAGNYMETAQTYANDTIKFLNEHSSDYPLWIGGKQENRTKFISFKI